MKVLLTGASGFIGSYLAEALVNKGYEVRCLIRTSSNLRWIADLDVECYYGTLNDPKSLQGALEGVDYVYHVAGLTKALEEKEYFNANFTGTKNLIDAIINSAVKIKRFVLLSSQAAAGPSPTIQPLDETAAPHPLTHYGKSKLQAEKYANEKSKQLPVTIIRPPVVFGPRDTDVLEFFKTVKKGIIPRLGGHEKYLSIIYVKDLVQGIISAAESANTKGKTYYLCNKRPYSWDEIARIALNVFNKKGFRVTVPETVMEGVSYLMEGISRLTKSVSIVNRQKLLEMKPDFWVCTPKAAQKDFGFEANWSLEESIRETLSWYLEHRWL